MTELQSKDKKIYILTIQDVEEEHPTSAIIIPLTDKEVDKIKYFFHYLFKIKSLYD